MYEDAEWEPCAVCGCATDPTIDLPLSDFALRLPLKASQAPTVNIEGPRDPWVHNNSCGLVALAKRIRHRDTQGALWLTAAADHLEGVRAPSDKQWTQAAKAADKQVGAEGTENSADQSGCFIATAAYGTLLSDDIDALRKWRDQGLNEHSVGQFLVSAYYRMSPPIARLIERHPSLQKLTRLLLTPVVRLAQRYYSQDGTDTGQ